MINSAPSSIPLDPTFRQTAVGAAVGPTSGRKIEELENAVIEYLRPGEDVVLANNPRPGTNFPPFIKLIMTLFAVVAEIPYELISGNYEGLNYSTSKLRNGQARHIIFSAHDRSSRKITRGTH